MTAGNTAHKKTRCVQNVGVLMPVVFVASALALLVGASTTDDAYGALGFFTVFDNFGKLGGPADVNIDGQRIYVVERDNNRVSIFFNNNGDYIFSKTFDSGGPSNGKLSGPTSIEKSDLLFAISDTQNKRVYVVDKNGNHEHSLGTQSSPRDDYVQSPSAVATDGGGKRIFVLDSVRNVILVFHQNGTFMSHIEKMAGDTMSNATAITVSTGDRDKYMYMADSGNDRIAEFILLARDYMPCPVSTQGDNGICFTKFIGGSGSGDAKFNDPAGLAVHVISDDVRDLYVSDTGNNRIQVLRLDSSEKPTCPSGSKNISKGVCFIEKIGSSGTSNKHFKEPRGMDIDPAKKLLYVADTGNDRIHVLKIDTTSGSTSTPPTTTTGSNSNSGSTTTTNSTTSDSSASKSTSTKPGVPRNIQAIPTSPTSILVKWSEPLDLGPGIIGYKVEYRTKAPTEQSKSEYQTVVAKTRTNATSMHHTNLDKATEYTYKVSAIGPAAGASATSGSSTTATAKPAHSDSPVIVDFVALTPKQTKIAWIPPSNTYNSYINDFVIGEQSTRGKIIKEEGGIGRSQTTYLYKVETNKEVSLAVSANFGNGGKSPFSEPATTVARSNSYHSGIIEPEVVELVSLDPPSPPIKVQTKPVTEKSIEITWAPPADDGNLSISGYTVEAKKSGSSSFETIASSLTNLKYTHTGLESGSTYTYRVYATNAKGDSDVSNESTATARTMGITVNTIGFKSVTEGETLSFTASVSGNVVAGDTRFTLNEAPAGANIARNSGEFTWTPSLGQGGETYVFEVEATSGSSTDGETVRVQVHVKPTVVDDDGDKSTASPTSSTSPANEPGLPSFVSEGDDPQTYIDRYNTDTPFREWYDKHHLERYGSIYDAMGILQVPADFVDAAVDPQSYVDRYNNEAGYKAWFDEHYSKYDSIYHATGVDDPSKDADDATQSGSGPAATGDAPAADVPVQLPRLDVEPAPFVDASEDPMTYVERYENDATYRAWFDDHYADEYMTIYRAVGLLDVPAAFVDASKDPMTYVERYENDATYRVWFDEHYSEYLSIYHAVGLPEPEVAEPEKQYGICGPGTKLVDGICTITDVIED